MHGTGEAMVRLEGVAKTFVLHLRGGATLPVLGGVASRRGPASASCSTVPRASGKSSVLKMIYGNYRGRRRPHRVRDGREWVDVATAPPRRILRLRQSTIGYVSQFLRVIPRVGALDIVAAAARETGLRCRGGQARGARAARPAQHPRAALAAAAGDLLRRRAAARQHRPRLRRGAPDPAARRADRLARCGQPRRRGRLHPRAQARPARRSSASSTTRTCEQQVGDRVVDVSRFRA